MFPRTRHALDEGEGGEKEEKKRKIRVYIYIYPRGETEKKFNVSRDEVSCSFLSTTDQRVLGRDSIKGGYLR